MDIDYEQSHYVNCYAFPNIVYTPSCWKLSVITVKTENSSMLTGPVNTINKISVITCITVSERSHALEI